MLGKQGWKFLTKPESLVSTLFKARYYHDNDFLNATIGNNPSYAWRSLWQAKSLIKSGVRWMIGSGEKININKQPWLDNEVNTYITTKSQILDNNTVASLMTNNGREWDEDVIRYLFTKRDQQCIWSTVLNSRREEDKLYWGKEISGNYSVKIVYKLLQNQKGL